MFWRYIQLIVLPVRMSVERSTDVPGAALTGGAIAAWMALIALIVGVMLLRRRAPTLERFSNTRALSIGVQGGFFLRKKPLCGRGLLLHQFEKRYSPELHL